MSRKCLFSALVIIFAMSLIAGTAPAFSANKWDGTIATSFAGGTGTTTNPYLIATGAQLAYLAQQVNGINNSYGASVRFRLTNDIDLDNREWTPIGIESSLETRAFRSYFDGNGRRIINLQINTPNIDNIGLFGYTATGAGISGLTLENVRIIGKDNVGSLVGYGYGIITNCSVLSGTITGVSNVGGLIGASGTIISSCAASVAVSGNREGTGGIVGWLISGSISDSAAIGTVKGFRNTGGFIGESYYAAISNSIATCSVEGTSYVGGFVGRFVYSSSAILDSMAGGTVIGTDSVAGFEGYRSLGGSISRSMSSGRVMGSGTLNAFAGDAVTDCAVDTQGASQPQITYGRRTSDFYSSATVPLGVTWRYQNGYYPRPLAIVNSSNPVVKAISALAAVPLYLANASETTANVTANFTVPTTTADGDPISWSASPSGILTINAGNVTINATGSVVLTATAGGFSKTFTLEVKSTGGGNPGTDIPLTSVRIVNEGVVNNVMSLSHEKTPSNANGTFSFIWSSNNTSIASVTPNGGRATVTAGDTAGTAIITLTVTQTLPSGSIISRSNSIDVEVTGGSPKPKENGGSSKSGSGGCDITGYLLVMLLTLPILLLNNKI